MPDKIPKIVSNKLDGPMLELFIDAVADIVFEGGGSGSGDDDNDPLQLDDAFAILARLRQCDRFAIVFMFAGDAERRKLTRSLAAMKRIRSSDNRFSADDVAALANEYGLGRI